MNSVSSSNKIYSLEILRFVAAFLVLLNHYKGYDNGFIGVDIFFIISGFVIMYATEKNTHFFFIRRLIRIIPLYWALTALFFFGLILFPNQFGKSTANIIFFLKSIFFIPFENNNIGPGYGHSPYIFLGWTLNFEIFFYFIFQISMLISHKFRGLIAIFLLLLINIFFSFAHFNNFILLTYSHPILLEFCFGITLFNIWKLIEVDRKINFLNIILPLLICILILFYLQSGLGDFRFRTSYTALSIVFFFTLILRNLPKMNFFLLLGSISYPIYLIHPYVRELALRLNNIFVYNFSYDVIFIFLIIIDVILAYLIFVLYEKPLIKYFNNLLKSF